MASMSWPMKLSCSGGALGGPAGGDVHQHADDGRAPAELGAHAEDFRLDRVPSARSTRKL
jgi:hypothetical protein